jgi:hypothetical protein
MRVKSLAHKNQMGKKKTTNSSTSWVPSKFSQSDLTKAQKEGLITEGDKVVFPSTERIPKPPSGYRVMFLAFLLCGLSCPAHEFLRGLLFVYGVQLHQSKVGEKSGSTSRVRRSPPLINLGLLLLMPTRGCRSYRHGIPLLLNMKLRNSSLCYLAFRV